MSLSIHYVIHQTRETFFDISKHCKKRVKFKIGRVVEEIRNLSKHCQHFDLFYISSQSKLKLRKKAKKIVNISTKSNIQTPSST